jgi:hypothetical protein
MFSPLDAGWYGEAPTIPILVSACELSCLDPGYVVGLRITLTFDSIEATYIDDT